MPTWAIVLTALLLWPLHRPGYLLGHDLVFTSRQPLDGAALGVSSASPRAVPVDALVALAERIVDGAVVGRLAVVLPVLAAGVGTAFLLGKAPLTARLAAGGAATWNPYVVERLGLGHWSLLWAYAALPWLIWAGSRVTGSARWAGQALALAAASITPTGGLIAGSTAVAVALGRCAPRRELLATAGLAAALQLPWLVPALASTAAATSDPAGVAAFAARDEHGGGALLSLLGGGGIWDADVMPDSRAGALPWLWLAVLLASAVYGAPRLARLLGRRLVIALCVLGAAGFLLAAASSVPGAEAVVRAAVRDVPGAGLWRDAQKWVLPLVLLEALLIGAAAARLLDRLCSAPPRWALLAGALALPLIVLPDGAAALRATLDPVHYPHDWGTVAAAAKGGDAVLLPWASHRRFPWAPGRSVLDPGPRLLSVPSVVDDRLLVGEQVVRGEDPRAERVGRALTAGAARPARLARLGIRWVVVEHGTPGPAADVRGLRPVHVGHDVSLYEVPGAITSAEPSSLRLAAVVAGDVVAIAALVGCLLVAGRRHRRRTSQPSKAAPLS